MQDGMRLTNLPVLTTQEPRARGKARADKLGGRGGGFGFDLLHPFRSYLSRSRDLGNKNPTPGWFRSSRSPADCAQPVKPLGSL